MKKLLKAITISQRDLMTYKDKELQMLARYYKIAYQDMSKENLAWALAIAILHKARYSRAMMLLGTETLPELRQKLNAARAAKAGLVAQIPEEGETPQDLLDRIRDKTKEILELDVAIKEAVKKEVAKEEPEPEIPEQARDCTNAQDYITNEEWTTDNLPDVKIRFLDRDDITKKPLVYCGERATLEQWLARRENHFAGWVPSVKGGIIEAEGYGGRPSQSERFVKLPGEIPTFVLNENFLEEFPDKTGNYIGLPVYKERRVGNLAGQFGVSQLHGQAPGYTIYLVVPETHYTLSAAQELKRGLTSLYLAEGRERGLPITSEILVYSLKKLGQGALASRIEQEPVEQFIRQELDPEFITSPFFAQDGLVRTAQNLFPDLYKAFDGLLAEDDPDPQALRNIVADIYTATTEYWKNPENDPVPRNRASITSNQIEAHILDIPEYKGFNQEYITRVLASIDEQILIKLIQDIVKDRYITVDYKTEWVPEYVEDEEEEEEEVEVLYVPDVSETDFVDTVTNILEATYLVFTGTPLTFKEEVMTSDYDDDPQEYIARLPQNYKIVKTIDDLDFLKNAYYTQNDQKFIRFINAANRGRLRRLVIAGLPQLTPEQVLTVIDIILRDGGFVIATRGTHQVGYLYESESDLDEDLDQLTARFDSVQVIKREATTTEEKQKLLDLYKTDIKLRNSINLAFFERVLEIGEDDLLKLTWQTLFFGVYTAARNNYPNIVDYLLGRGASIHDALRGAKIGGHQELVDNLVGRGADESVFEIPRDIPRGQLGNMARIVAFYGDRVSLEGLLQAGADLSAALAGAVDPTLIDYLIKEKGANPTRGFTSALYSKNEELIRLYIDKGYTIDWTDEELSDAAGFLNPDLVQFLIDNGANPVEIFYSAVGAENQDLVGYLVSTNIPKKPDFDWNNAYDIALDAGNSTIINMVRELEIPDALRKKVSKETIAEIIANPEFQLGAEEFPQLYARLVDASEQEQREALADIYIEAVKAENAQLVELLEGGLLKTKKIADIPELLKPVTEDREWGLAVTYLIGPPTVTLSPEQINQAYQNILGILPPIDMPPITITEELTPQIILRRRNDKFFINVETYFEEEMQEYEKEITREELLALLSTLKEQGRTVYDNSGRKFRLI